MQCAGLSSTHVFKSVPCDTNSAAINTMRVIFSPTTFCLAPVSTMHQGRPCLALRHVKLPLSIGAHPCNSFSYYLRWKKSRVYRVHV